MAATGCGGRVFRPFLCVVWDAMQDMVTRGNAGPKTFVAVWFVISTFF